ncbi:hypothetical protein LPJ66_011869 [Kickxella alabastrina]|uniref:Uncharacterized protein n=1 Tax=Kickxella alabastrina TaxID=61397 RepID=A0ACC1HWV8_9FUNG|nr:hypothetical protein LPJ66_011869 [Kickxella alabastrina]
MQQQQQAAEPMSQQYIMQIMDYLSVYNQPANTQQQHQHQHQHQQQTHHQQQQQQIQQQQQAASFTAQFPRLTSESGSESTASPELPSNLPISTQMFGQQQQQPATAFTYSYSHPLYNRPMTHHHSFTAPLPSSQMMLSNDTTSAAAAAAAATAMAMSGVNVAAASHHSHSQQHSSLEPMPLVQNHSAHNLSMYFNAPGSAHDFIDPSALANTAQSHIIGLPKSRSMLHPHTSSLSSSLSPTPTPTSENRQSVLFNPAFNPSAQLLAASDPSTALQFSIAPHKLQFKSDHEILM